MSTENNNPYKGKEIVFQSILSRLVLLLVLLIAAIFGALYGNYIIAVFSLIIFALFVYKTSKTVFLAPNSQSYQDYLKWQEVQWQNDLGPFSYIDDGFLLTAGENEHPHQWSDVDVVLGYRPRTHMEELYAVQVTMSNGYKFRMTDNTEGWIQFAKHLQQALSIPDNWRETLSAPVSESEVFHKVLFDRLQRTETDALGAYDETLDDHDRTKFTDSEGKWIIE